MENNTQLIATRTIEPCQGRGSSFVGRSATLERLMTTLRAARAGEGCLLLLHGERGIGKTATAEQLIARARTEGIEVLSAHCSGEPHAPVLGPWLEMLSQLGQAAHAAGSEAPLGWPPEVRHFVQLAGAALAPYPLSPRLEPSAARVRLLTGLSEVLLDTPKERPRLLFIDDVDRADPLSLQMLVHLAGELEGRPLLVLVCQRDGELSEAARHALGRLERMGTTRSLRLGGLELEEVDEYLRHGLLRTAPRALVERLHRASQGNPFVLAACVRRIVHSGRGLSDSALLALELPAAVAAAARQRLLGLGPSCLEVLSVASVFGVELREAALRAATGLDEGRVRAGLGEAFILGVVAPHPHDRNSLRFTHALLREVLYEALPGSRRAKLHAQVARAVEADAVSRGGPWAEVAFHYHRSLDPAHSPQVEHYAQEAEKQLSAQHGYEQAAEFIGMALDARGWAGHANDLRAAELLLALMRAEFAGMHWERGQQALARLLELAQALDAPQLAAEAALSALSAAPSPALAGGAAQALPQLLRALPEHEGALRAQVMSRMAACNELSSDTRKRLAQRASDVARAAGGAAAARAAERARIHALQGPDDVAELLAATAALTAGQLELDDPRWAWDLHAARYVALLASGEPNGLDAELLALQRIGSSLRDPVRAWHVARWSLERELWSGRWEHARERLARQRARGRRLIGERADFIHAVELFQWTRVRGGPMSYRAADSERMERDARKAGATFRSAFALFLGRAGRTAEARERLAALARDDFEAVRTATTLEPLVYLAELSALLGDELRAQRIFELLSPYAELSAVSGFGWYMGSIGLALGSLAAVLGQRDEAAAYLTRALDTHERLGAQPLVDQTRAALAELQGTGSALQS